MLSGDSDLKFKPNRTANCRFLHIGFSLCECCFLMVLPSLSHDTVLSGLSSLIMKPHPSSHGRVFFLAFLTSLIHCICRNTTVLHRACSLAFNQPQLPHLSLAADTAECQLAAASALLCLETMLFQDGFFHPHCCLSVLSAAGTRRTQENNYFTLQSTPSPPAYPHVCPP